MSFKALRDSKQKVRPNRERALTKLLNSQIKLKNQFAYYPLHIKAAIHMQSCACDVSGVRPR
jgi:hypothetical protein